jgi:(S)-2-hydroxy-acid oxidase
MEFISIFKACQSMGTIMILSTIATSSIEEVSKAAPNAIKWFQLYIYKDRNVTRELVKRAENSGFKALVLTVDTPMFGHRFADSRNRFHLPPHLRMANFDKGNIESDSIQNSPTNDSSGLNDYALSLFDPSITWKDVEWLKSITSLPIVLKGILTREDALLAIKYGASAILVSNHGARQLDGVPATVSLIFFSK